MPDTRRIFHFVFGLRPQEEPFHLAHYLCLESCRQVNQPTEIRFHYRHLPWGPWWDRIAPFLTLQRIPERAAGYDPSRYAATAEGRAIVRGGWDYAHEADFVRLDILLEHGGVYADIDTLFIQAYPDGLFEADCTLGEESPVSAPGGQRVPSLCNAVIVAKPGAEFIRRWQHGARDAFDGSWSRHSCQEATRLWSENVAPVRVLPRLRFYAFGPTPAHFRALFEESAAVPAGALSIHLWSHLWWSERRTDFTRFHAGLLTPEHISAATTTYSRLAKPFLPATPVQRTASARARPKCILLFNPPAGHSLDGPGDDLPDGYCLSADPSRLDEAVAVVFHVPSLDPRSLPARRPGQWWVAWYQECEAHYPSTLGNPAFMAGFDLVISHQLHADVVTAYVHPDFATALRAPPVAKTAKDVAAAFISSPYDASGRFALLSALMEQLPVGSFGRALNNRPRGHDEGRATKLATIARHPFTLAFENAIATDYVTEKFFDPLLAGSVPVYLGAPNAERFAPGDDCYIDASQFSDPRSLAQHLRNLAADPAAYRRHLAWKDRPLRPEFLALLEQQTRRPLVRLCALIESRVRAGQGPITISP